ncbi:hypothetical protein Pmani_025551 [Petrolisthes manimaculis]|uniref:Methylmalonic aciduria and homocystinuria type D protein, mitochondrial n=1 Tax=Petrolisthes manimaculis TaxID=1843537 RepID=A0AAE1P7X3_9EUCA|nr:hypothetical protein Pmani_025551 [Petrolisthes manimaculis]
MAARLLSSGERSVVVYAKNLQSLCVGLRCFSSQGRNNSNETAPPPDVKDVTGEPLSTWLDIKSGIFGPSDQRLPLPGNVGLVQQLLPINPGTLTSISPVTSKTQTTSNLLAQQINENQQLQALDQCSFNGVVTITEDTTQNMSPNPSDILECKAQLCPDLVKKDFLDLFPGRNLRDGPLAVVTLSQKTQHDMSAWTEEMELEREELLECFIVAAEDICNTLESEGYWADFIDPSSGRPYHGEFTNATLFETDERYRYFGFCIEDLGCCKIISHRLWGTHVFVGAIFTNAPVESEVLDMALKKHKNRQNSS